MQDLLGIQVTRPLTARKPIHLGRSEDLATLCGISTQRVYRESFDLAAEADCRRCLRVAADAQAQVEMVQRYDAELIDGTFWRRFEE